MRVCGPLHLTNKVIMKEQFTQWYVGRVAANLKKGTKKHLIIRLALGKPIHAR